MSLVEVLLAIILGCVVITLSSRLMLSIVLERNALFGVWESELMWHSLIRVMRDDVHAATVMSVSPGSFQVRETDGTHYRYTLNQTSELVRVRTGGGTVVLASHIRSFAVALTGALAEVKVTTEDGTLRTMTLTERGDGSRVPNA